MVTLCDVLPRGLSIESCFMSPLSFKAYGGSVQENYEKYFVPAIGASLAAELVELAALSPGERVLDLACGTGAVARLAAPRVGASGTVAGVDVNPGMLAVARANTPAGMSIEWHEASADQLPFADGSLDVVLCSLGLQFFPNRLAALDEVRRILVSDGRVIVNAPGPIPDVFSVLERALAAHVGPEAAAFVRLVFSLHDTAEMDRLLSEAGFRDISVAAGARPQQLPEPREFLWQYIHGTPLAGSVNQLDDEHRAALEAAVLDGWQACTVDDKLLLDGRIVVATARR
jgi:ubiquinone/menaquinone biosynthesis C-methylase UbiE